MKGNINVWNLNNTLWFCLILFITVHVGGTYRCTETYGLRRILIWSIGGIVVSIDRFHCLRERKTRFMTTRKI